MEATKPISQSKWQDVDDIFGAVVIAPPTRLKSEEEAAVCLGGPPTGNPTTWFVSRAFAIEALARTLFAYGSLSHRLAVRLNRVMCVVDELALPSPIPRDGEAAAAWTQLAIDKLRERERSLVNLRLLVNELEEKVKKLKQERQSLNFELSRAKSIEAENCRLLEGLLSATRANHGGVQFEVKTADGHAVERGDRVYFGSRPKEHAFVIDPDHAIDPASGRIVGLSEGDPIFAKRDNARAWRRTQPNTTPTSSAVTGTAAAGTTQSAGGTAAAPAAAGTVFELLSPAAIDGGPR